MLSVLLIIVVISLTGCGEKKTKDGKIIGTSNPASDTKLQIKIIANDNVDITVEKNIHSDVVGVVQKDSVFDVIDHEQEDTYRWVHIKTDNNLEGYVVSFEGRINFEFINGDIDFLAPKLEIKVDKVEVESYSKITDEYIKSIIEYSDDKDDNPTITYETTPYGTQESPYDERIYYLNIKVKDASNNETTKKVRIYVKNEIMASNGKWLSQNQIRNLRKQFLNITRKYGSANGYAALFGTYWKIVFFSSRSQVQVFTDNGWFSGCDFVVVDGKLNAESCYDSMGSISYEEMHKKISKQEQSALDEYNKIISEFEKTGYKLSDLFLLND